MEVIYTLDEDDALHFYLFARRRFRQIPGRLPLRPRRRLLPHRCAGLVMSVLGTAKPVPLQGLVDGLVCVASGCYLFWWPSTANLRRTIRRRAQTNEGFLCRHTLTISPEWLHEVTHVNDSKARWQSLQEITEDADYLYFIMKTKLAHPVPKRAFLNPDDARQFLEQANRYLMNAQRYGPAPEPDDEAVWPPPPTTRLIK